MVRGSTETTHKLSGVGGSFSNIETFSSSLRLHNCCSVHQQTRRNKVSSVVLQDLGSVEICNSKQHTYQSSSYFRGAKCLGRSAIQEQNSANRMDSPQVCGLEDFSALGLSFDRPICIDSESPDTDILFLGSSSPCSSIGCIVSFMGENVHICLSSHLPNSQGSQHMAQFHCQIVLIAPKWPRRHWYTDLLQFLIACRRRLPSVPNLLHQPNSSINHPNPEIFSLHAWLLSTKFTRERLF